MRVFVIALVQAIPFFDHGSFEAAAEERTLSDGVGDNVGAECGSGVLLAKGNSGQWSYPAFYTMGAASIGIQFGGQISETILIIMTRRTGG